MKPISQLLHSMQRGDLTSRDLVEQYLAAATDPAGEGQRVFLKLDAEAVRNAADNCDRQRKSDKSDRNGASKPLLGLPISVKDLCDVVGEVTTAGSIALKDNPPAKEDAPIIARMRAAGAIPFGRTNMTEFAFSGLGINPHYGTPRNPYDRASVGGNSKNPAGRIPGGSSSGAVVSVTDGMAAAAIGSDTGGSIRIPAAVCGATGFKPTQRRVPTAGAFPLSRTMDSLGPIAPTVACCALIDSIFAGNSNAQPPALEKIGLSGLRLGVLQGYVLDDLDPDVARAFESALANLAKAGAHIEDFHFANLDDIPKANSKGTVPTYEGYDQHKDLIAKHGDLYDPIVRSRMLKALDMTVTDYSNILEARKQTIAAAEPQFAQYDAVLLPSVACTAPRIALLEADLDAYLAANQRILRNPSVFNFLDGCALSIPIHKPGEAPVGLKVAQLANHDAKILRIGNAIESALASAGHAIPGSY